MRYAPGVTVTLDDKQLRRYERELKRFAAEALPFANRQALNSGAKMMRGLARENIGRAMILRNRFTTRFVGIEFARQKNIRQQQSVVGSFQDYMEDQEFGGTTRAKGKHGVVIPTRSASGEGEGSGPRRKLPKPRFTVRNIKLSRGRGRRAKTQRQINAITVQQAVRTGRRIVFMKTQRSTGFFRVMGGKRRPRVKMLADLSRKTVSNPPNPWLKPAADRTTKAMPAIYRGALREQLIRRRLFR